MARTKARTVSFCILHAVWSATMEELRNAHFICSWSRDFLNLRTCVLFFCGSRETYSTTLNKTKSLSFLIAAGFGSKVAHFKVPTIAGKCTFGHFHKCNLDKSGRKCNKCSFRSCHLALFELRKVSFYLRGRKNRPTFSVSCRSKWMKCIATACMFFTGIVGCTLVFFSRSVLCKRELRIGISCSSTTRNKRMSKRKDNIARPAGCGLLTDRSVVLREGRVLSDVKFCTTMIQLNSSLICFTSLPEFVWFFLPEKK